jgi:hypothetical protein
MLRLNPFRAAAILGGFFNRSQTLGFFFVHGV